MRGAQRSEEHGFGVIWTCCFHGLRLRRDRLAGVVRELEHADEEGDIPLARNEARRRGFGIIWTFPKRHYGQGPGFGANWTCAGCSFCGALRFCTVAAGWV